jgi:hypothetical protein
MGHDRVAGHYYVFDLPGVSTGAVERFADQAVNGRERHGAELPDAVLFGHSGSTSAHPVVADVSRAVRRLLPAVTIVYGGVSTYHRREILNASQIDVTVRGEGEDRRPAAAARSRTAATFERSRDWPSARGRRRRRR